MLYAASTWVLPALLAITLHEAAHGYAAMYLGDSTAKERGRVSLNPFRHVDLVGTFILPAILILSKGPLVFGWAKPVPVDFGRLRNPRRDMVWVAAAGPAVNLFIALLSARLICVVSELPLGTVDWAFDTLKNSLFLNVILLVFNLIPLPPLDGGRIAVGLLPIGAARRLARLEKYGMFLIIGILIGLPWLGYLIDVPIRPFAWVVLPVVDAVITAIAFLAGLI
ncbi:MAG: site-2 protease family protein [Rhodospirillaceae bacterium]|nr:site-2 protease family protein [Rhodospirillaceae bacterium]